MMTTKVSKVRTVTIEMKDLISLLADRVLAGQTIEPGYELEDASISGNSTTGKLDLIFIKHEDDTSNAGTNLASLLGDVQ